MNILSTGFKKRNPLNPVLRFRIKYNRGSLSKETWQIKIMGLLIFRYKREATGKRRKEKKMRRKKQKQEKKNGDIMGLLSLIYKRKNLIVQIMN